MIELCAGKMRLTLDADTGGAIAALSHGGVDLLRPVADARLRAQNGRAVAAYPLLPFANRIAYGRFTVGGRGYQLAPNFGDEPHAIHGNGWMHPWAAAQAGDATSTLVFDYAPVTGEWPFAYHAEQAFSLDDRSVRLTLLLRNTDDVTWPAGIGLHPYVARTAWATLAFRAGTVWTRSAAGLPEHEIGIPGALDFAQERPVGAEAVDACFAGWDGEAMVRWPELGTGLCLSAGQSLDHLQVYTPAGQDFMGIEPVSNMPDGINRIGITADQGMRLLAPGETLRAEITLAVTS
jgi:aldose 1-epimerase